jgi:hypothetical protein
MRDPVETDETDIETDTTMDSATAARIRQYAYVESGRRGGSKKGPTKARQGTSANVARYWDRVYAGEIQHPGFDPKKPKCKSTSKRYDPATGTPRDASHKARKARTDIPSPSMAGFSDGGGADEVAIVEDEFAATLGRMGF